MRLAKLSLLAFGGFTGQELDFGPPGSLAIVYGPNEAGKSTSLRAVEGALFGIEVQTKDAYLHAMSDLRIGATVVGEDGEILTFVRRKGKRGNTLLDTDGKPMDEAALAHLLGSATKESFASTHGLDHTRLRAGADELLEGKGALGEALFGASLGSVSLHALRKRVDEEAAAFFAPTGKVLPLNKALRDLADKRKDVATEASNASAYEQQLKTMADQASARDAAIRDRAALAREEARLSQLLAVLPELDEAERRLSAHLDDERLTSEARARLVVDPGLTAAADAMDAVRERLSEQAKAVVELPGARAGLRAAELEVAEALRALGRSDASSPESLLLQDAAEAEIAQLAGEAAGVEARLGRAREAIALATARLGAAPSDAVAGPLDATKLEAALDRARDAGDLESAIDRLRARAAKLAAAQHARVAALGGDAALSARPPSLEEVAACELTAREATRDAVAARAKVAELKDALTEKRLELDRLLAQGTPPSTEDVARARLSRDDAWAELLAAKASDRAAAQARFPERVRAADDAADSLLRESAGAYAHARLRLEVAAVEQRLSIAAECAQGAERAREASESAWRDLWKGVAAEAGTHERMRAWLGEHAAALGGADALREVEAELAALQRRADSVARALTDALAVGPLGFAEARALAERTGKALADARARARETAIARRAAEESRDVAQAELGSAQQAHDDWRVRWASALRPLGLEPAASVPAAQADVKARARLRAALATRRTAASTVARLDRTTTDLDLALAGLRATHAPDLAEASALDAARELLRRGSANAQASAEAKRLDERLTELAATLARERTTVARLRATADEAAAGLTDRSIPAVRARLAELEPTREELDRTIETTARQIATIELGVAKFTESRAATAASEAEEIRAHASELLERYAKLKLASAVLDREIEAFRTRHQGPVLSRASEHFRALTGGRYEGLREGFGEQDEPVLRAVQGRVEVPIGVLSEGARDAVYLGLRLALWEHLSRTNVPLPVILDDVLIQLDDDRATAALVRLAEVAQRVQVVLFTHHARIVEQAERELGARAHVLRLSGPARP